MPFVGEGLTALTAVGIPLLAPRVRLSGGHDITGHTHPVAKVKDFTFAKPSSPITDFDTNN